MQMEIKKIDVFALTEDQRSRWTGFVQISN